MPGTSVTVCVAVFLKSLTLKGFKSFADSTVLEMEPGVTVVVGPNGSGKSNIVDAIAWVLGAQAPSAVRSQKMEDVIFNGTSKRTALGRAEVALTLDNSAGVLPLDFSEITIARTLFRNGDSEYSLNGVDCRLRDIQDLLSDAGVGRQQHVIIGQGQIDAVLTARAEDRRAIIEEAAGILKYRKRKESAERKLESTEANLMRVQDLIREVRRQLRPLERQADAARKHDSVQAELRALRLYLSGREIVALRGRLGSLAEEKGTVHDGERSLRERLEALDADVRTAETELSARGDSGLNDEFTRVEQLRERARGLLAVIAERRRSMERDRGQLIADDVVAAMETDAERMRLEIDEVERGLSIADAENQTLAVEEENFEREREEQGLFHVVQGHDASNSAAEVRGELRTLRNAVEQAAGEIQRLDAAHQELETRESAFASVIEGLQRELAEVENASGEARAHIRSSEDQRDAAEAALGPAQEALAAAERRLARTIARVESLEAAAAAAKARAGAEHLAQVTGVIGAFVDQIAIDEDWEAAVAAALGEALSAVVVNDPLTARRALEALRSSGHTGAVLALGRARAVAGTLPPGVEPVRARVRGVGAEAAGLNELIEALLGHVGCVADLGSAISVVEANPGAVVVTRQGDRLAPTGWRLGAADDAATEQVLEAARRERDTAQRDRDEADAALAGAWEAVTLARAEMVSRQADHDARVRAVEAVSDRLTGAVNDRRACVAEREVVAASVQTVRGRLGQLQVRVGDLESLLPGLEEAEAAELAAEQARSEARAAIDSKASHLAMRRKDLDVRIAGLRERDQFLRRRLEETEARLLEDSEARREFGARREVIEQSLAALDRISALVEGHRAVLDEEHVVLGEMRQRQSREVRDIAARIDLARRERHEVEQELERVRDRSHRIDVEEAEARMRLEASAEMVQRELEVEPDVAEGAPMPDVPEGTTHEDRAAALEREIRLMGPINPLALQEFNELQERHRFLDEQLTDVRNTRRELSQVIEAIDGEIKSVFAEAFTDVSRNFGDLFAMLFPGGRGRLSLTEPGDMLNTGVEIEAAPPGKTMKKLSLLSGGERSLTAIAYLFAIFRSRPSPFYVMDEVEAALDDVNLHRFLELIGEFRREAQLILVSHQKRTMEVADSLVGVTAAPGGSSKVVTERPTDTLAG